MAQLTTGQLNMLRGGGYEGSAYLVAGPQSIVFAARVNGTPTASDFAQISYDTVTTGAYTDSQIGHDIRISRTNDIRASFFLGRIRKTPTSTILYINETSAAILDNDYVWIVDNYPLVIRQRYKSFVDWDVPYQPLPPIESNVDSAYVSLTTAASASFSLSSIGQALEKSATISSLLWTIPGATYTVGSATTAHITISVTTPYNKWASLRLTDSNGTTNTLRFTITAGNPNTDTFFRLCHEPPPIGSDWDNGFSTSVSFWAGVNDLLDRTRITIVSNETFNGASLGVGNVQFVGYLQASTSNTSGDDTYGQRKDVEFEIKGLMQLAADLRFNPIAIRRASSPSAWDYINIPTYQRNICHLLSHHSTLLNLISLDFGTINDTYSSGNSNLSETSLTDAARSCIKEVNGALISSPAGKITLIRDPRVGSDAYRASLPDKTPSAIDLADGYSYKLIDNDTDSVGWLEVGFAVIQPTTLSRTYITANAPASGPGDGQEDATEPSQLLAATGALADALSEARQRTGDLYALANTHRTIEWALTSGWGSVVRATPGEYYQFLIAAADDVRGVGVSASDDWLCLSVNTTINRNGTQDITARFTEVTQGGDALINVAISPSVVETPLPVLPIVSAYPAYPPAPSINYDTTSPTTKLPRDPFSGMQTLPLTTEEAAQAAQNQGTPGCSVFAVSFRSGTNVSSGFVTTLSAAYTMHLSGSAQIAVAEWQHTFNFLSSQSGWARNTFTAENVYGTWVSGQGWLPDDAFASSNYRRGIDIAISGFASTTFTYFQIKYNYAGIAFVPPGSPALFGQVGATVNTVLLVNDTAMTAGNNQYAAWTGSLAATSLRAGLNTSVNNASATYGGTGTVTEITVRGTGTNPFTGGASTPLYADAFYTWQLDANNKPSNVQLNTAGGIRLDNAAVAVAPPFNENHEYDITFTGTGNVIQMKFLDSAYTDNQSALLRNTVCGVGAGS